MNKFNSKLITFSGLDGAGKSTQRKILTMKMNQIGYKPMAIWTRGGQTQQIITLTNFYKRVNKAVYSPSLKFLVKVKTITKPLVRKVWLVGSLVELFFIYAIKIRLLKSLGKTIICNRYLIDTQIDFDTNFSKEKVSTWCFYKILHTLTPKPDFAFLLMIPVEESLKRIGKFEVQSSIFLEKLNKRHQKYLQETKQNDWLVLDGTKPASEIAKDVFDYLNINMDN